MSVPDRSSALSPERPSLLTASELAQILQVSRCQVDRMVAAGLPALDVGIPRPGRRPKRSLRFDQAAVVAWLAARGGRS